MPNENLKRKKTWLEKRTNLEKQFLVILAISFIILTFLVSFMFSMYLRYGFALKFSKFGKRQDLLARSSFSH